MSEQEKIKKETIESNLGHTLEDLYDDAFEDGANWQKEQMINKACDWIKQQQDMLEDCFSDAGDFADLLKEAMEDKK